MPMRPAMPLAAIALAALAPLAECRTALLRRSLRPSASCTELANRGSHFSVEVAVGTPPQKFDVVADTGSNTFIVPSCICQREGNCNKEDDCFVGTNRSSTFSVSNGPEGPQELYLSFGSGTIEGVLVQDLVQVGPINAYMKDGLLLMTDQALDFGGPFEGILGLGVPTPEEPKRRQRKQPFRSHSSRFDDLVHQLRKALQGQLPEQEEEAPQPPVYVSEALARQQPEKMPLGFLEEANVSRFSMCFNYNADGVLRFGAATQGRPHGSIGTLHWGLGFQGVSVGQPSAKVGSICKADPKRATPCGAIPDSGTTLIMAPRAHVLDLFEDLCERWPRCTQNHTAMKHAARAAREAAAAEYGFNPFVIEAASKAHVLQTLLLDCHLWMNETDGLKEMPPIFLHVEGSNGTTQTLQLPPQAYVLEQEMRHTEHAASLLDVDRSTAGKVCSMAFGAMDYITENNGPIWIMGTPIFYEFNVGYDMSSTPPSVSFSSVDSEPCGSCGRTVGLVAAEATGRPRFLPGPARLPSSIDLEEPL